jgi:aerobic carbon-monoxide dehydrogenase medium subunit
MLLPKLEYLAPKNADELSGFLADHQGKARILAGGTDIIPNMLNKLYKVDYLVDVSAVTEMQGIVVQPGQGVTIGAATKLREIAKSTVVAEKYPALQKAASEVGSPAIRAMATIGGNSCNASPAADTPPALVALAATVCIAGKQGRREMLLEDFILGNRIIDLNPGEYLEKFVLPEPAPRSSSRFGLVTLRAAVEIDIASLAVNLTLDEGGVVIAAKIAMGSVAPVPLRALQTEKILIGQKIDDRLIERAADKCAGEAKPIDDIRASATYRRHLIKVLTKRTIQETIAAIG